MPNPALCGVGPPARWESRRSGSGTASEPTYLTPQSRITFPLCPLSMASKPFWKSSML